jgi:hypothetical protein
MSISSLMLRTPVSPATVEVELGFDSFADVLGLAHGNWSFLDRPAGGSPP